ncbi:YihY/virulence factor BrkB family protein [Acidipila sp. EB88]|uniref:YihY/virulence factor BrkB family protein n=1 Tax=Acidipila sp. EB88 TaxID=2305226 RepID=UPI00131544C6|nr:YihY/virulence factor BrkB family protein [Acidipila sp. EB88]
MGESTTVRLKRVTGKVTNEVEKFPHLATVVFNEVMRTRVLTIGAAVAFFLLLSLVPLLIVASAMISALPIPNLWEQLLELMAMLVPPEAMVLVRSVLTSILTAHPARILSIGILSYIWAAAGSFSAIIEALNIAYDVDVEHARSWWRDKLQALLLTFTCGGLSVFSLMVLIAGPPFIHFLSYILPVPKVFAVVWPPIRYALLFTAFVTNVMLLYYFGPNRKITFRSAWPGAALAVGFWVVGSLGLGFYLGHFANYSATYGSLGAIIVLMLWLYLISVSLLVGAELNAELEKRALAGAVSVAAPARAAERATISARTPGTA